MAENGEDKVIALARQIARTLGHSDSMADDILQTVSNYDGRFSRGKASHRHHAGEDTRPADALERMVKSFQRRISQYVAAADPIWSDSSDSSAFLDSVDELIATVRDWMPMSTKDKSVSNWLLRAEDLLQQAMLRVEEEYKLLLERGGESMAARCSSGSLSFDSEDENEAEVIADVDDLNQIPVAEVVTDYDIVIDAVPLGTLHDLQEMTKRMVNSGFGKECSNAYSGCRTEFLEESLCRLGLRDLSVEDVDKMRWEDLEDEIDKWIKATNVALRILFPSERLLCDRVFLNFIHAADFSFMAVCRGSVARILSLVNAIAAGSRSPERLFKMLDLFETLRDLMPEFESNFSDRYCLVLRNDAVAAWKRLKEATRGIFMELENLIRRDPAKVAMHRCELHPVTRYVMNFLRAACRSRETLEQVFMENGAAVASNDPSSSPLSVQMAWIMELLESNLETKAKIYRDSSQACVFLLNNEQYIVQKAKDNELGLLLGDDWMRQHASKIKQLVLSYQRSSWNKVLGLLKVDHNPSSLHAEEHIRLFNVYFEEICKIQSKWIIFDERLRDDLILSLTNLLLPLYRNFVSWLDNAPSAAKYIKHQAEDVGAHIHELFRGAGQ